MLELKKNRGLIRWIAGGVLLLLVVFSYSFEQVPRFDGMGWDGIIYGGMMQEFLSQFKGVGYSSYYIKKCLPFALINIFDTLFHVTDSYVTLVVFEMISIVLAVVAFYKTSNYLKLSTCAETIAFALLFYTHFILRIGYLPYQGDVFAFSISMWIFYFFVSKQLWKMLALSIVGAFVWQSIWPISLLLFVLPQEGFNLVDGKHVSQRYGKVLNTVKIAMSLGLLVVPLKMFMFAEKKFGSWSRFSDTVPYFFEEIPVWMCVISIVSVCILLYLSIKPLVFNVGDFIKHTMKSFHWGNLIVVIVLFFLMKYVVSCLSNADGSGSFIGINFLRRLFFEPFTIPYKFFASHLANEGLMVCFLIVFYKPVWEFVSEHSIGYIAVFIMALFFGTQTESRFILNLFPFLVFPISVVISRLNLKKWVPYLVCVGQLLLSLFWYKTNTPTLAQALEIENDEAYMSGEAQRVFYYLGPWMGRMPYIVFLLIFVSVMIFMYLGKKYGWFVLCEKDKEESERI